MKQLFECKNHHEYLRSRLDSRNSKRGTKTALANYLSVQPAFLSQVLNEKMNLNLEHADLSNQFFQHTPEESNFFILMVSKDRAGTKSLAKFYDEQIETILKKRLLVSERLGKKASVSEMAKAEYYTSWIYAGVHVAATVDGMNSTQDLSNALGLPLPIVGRVIDFLLANNLLEKKGAKFTWTDSWVRIDKSSPHIVKHHSHWRQKAIANLEVQTDDDLHYSGLFSMDKHTAFKIKDKLMECIKENLKLVENSPEKDVFLLNTDFFSILNRK